MNKLIFSNQPYYRIWRHVLFWFARFSLIFVYSYGVAFYCFLTSGDSYFLKNLKECFEVGSFRVGVDIGFSYLVAYWLIPNYLFKKKYWLFCIILAGITLASWAAVTFFSIQYYSLFAQQGLKIYYSLWYQSIHFILGGPPIVCAAFLAIKMLKTWYEKEEEKTAITSAHACAELQLLKAQIHPHFLFNTLNNIYSFTLVGHPQAVALADRLSGMMDYMDSGVEKDLVPVEKEIQLIRDYITLEQVRYDERLEISVEIDGDFENKVIAPLLLIPFAENCFKHGASQVRGKQCIKLRITTGNEKLYFELRNSKPATSGTGQLRKGIGLRNVKKRLELIYPGQHVLRTETTDSVYRVHLEVTLQDSTELSPVDPQQTFSYA